MVREYRVQVALVFVDGPREVRPTLADPKFDVRVQAESYDAAVAEAERLVKLAVDDSIVHAQQVSPA